MVKKAFHMFLDTLFLAALVAAGWLVTPELGLFALGVCGLLLHYAAVVGSYDYEDDE